jgi:plastocyanin
MNSLRLWASAAALAFLGTAWADDPKWVTLKGQVVLSADAAKAVKPADLNVNADKEHCLSKGPIKANDLIVNANNNGLKFVFVYLRPDSDDRAAKLNATKDIHPDLQKPKPTTHEVDQPCCMFVPRCLAIREGDFVKFKNSSPVSHNTNLESEAPGPSFNKTIPSKGEYKDPKAFLAQRSQIKFACTMHPWMDGKLMVFDHPYYALTDDDGKFEIKNAPAGKYRLVYHHENGFHKGKEGRNGLPVEIKAGANGTMELKPLTFEFPKP